MKEIIKIERFLKAYENTWDNQRWQIECEGYSRLNEYTLNVSSDFGDYPDLIVFEAELLTIDKSLINEKIKSMNSICDKMIDDFDFIMSNHKFTLNQKIGISNFHYNYLTPIDNKSNAKVLNFNDNDLINTIEKIKSIIENIQPQPESDFDINDKTNPLIFNYQLIVDLHRDFSNYLWNTIDIDNFKNCFRKIPKKLEFHKNITLPEICYFFGKIEYKETVVKPFSDWMVYHIGGNNYGKNKAEFNRIVKEAKDKRYNNSLTTPQQKAIENKQKIDTLFNRILSN